MGQHSSPSEWHFYRSVVMWFLPWVVIAGVIGVAVWIGVDALSGGGGKGPVVAQEPSPSTSPSPEETPSPDRTPRATPSETPTPKETKSPDRTQELITEGIDVQILNASGTAGAEDAMSDRLERLGFEVVTVEQASTNYPETTVFWSFQESKDAAEALADRFGWIA